jgi:hypothetical protein
MIQNQKQGKTPQQRIDSSERSWKTDLLAKGYLDPVLVTVISIVETFDS